MGKTIRQGFGIVMIALGLLAIPIPANERNRFSVTSSTSINQKADRQ